MVFVYSSLELQKAHYVVGLLFYCISSCLLSSFT